MASEFSRKRKSSTDQDGRLIKHRASKACQACRTRKVRCDVLVNASRCTNCRLDQLECVVLASRRGHNKRRRNLNPASPQPVGPESARGTSNAVEPATEGNWSAPERAAESVPICVTFDDDTSNDKDNDDDSDGEDGDDVAKPDAANSSPSAPYAGLLTPKTRPDNSSQQQNTTERAALPAFVMPLSRQIPSEDLDYLIRKGALAMPEPDLQIEILRSYLFSVHPFMPMLDYRTLIHAVLSDGQDERISLLLFQAVMFAGLHSLAPAIVHRLGFESAKQARAVFFSRVRLLYEFDVEPDMASVLQSLILMSSWYSKWDARRDTWHWTGLAYDVARRMGLHREASARLVSAKVRRFRRRLWWSLYIRDRMIALGTRRPLRIYDSDCDVGMLTLDDFDLEPFHEGYQGQSLIPNVKENEATARMCIRLAKLCICVGRVVSSQYTTLRSQHDQDIPHAVMVVSRRDEGRAKDLESCDQQLTDWYQELTATGPPTIVTTGGTTSHSCSEVHWAVLNMTYHTTVNVLHRTQALQPISQAPTGAQSSSRSKVKRSARDLTKLLQLMLRRDQLRFVGLIGVTAIIAAYLCHVLDITSADNNNDDDVLDASTFRLYQSLEVLQAFREIYASADAAVVFLASVSRKAGISMPMQATGADIDLPSTTREPTLSIHDGKQVSRPGQVVQDARSTDRQTYPYPVVTAAVSKHQGHQQIPQRSSVDGQGSNMTQMTGLPVASCAPFTAATENAQAPHDSMDMAPMTQHGQSYSSDNALAGFVGSACDGVSFFDWGDSIDSRGNNLDLGLMSFDHDFYIDTFGFTDTRLQGL